MKFKVGVIILASLITINSFAEKQCTISGEIINRKSTALLLRKCSENPKVFYEKPEIIPIVNGRFNYSFSYSDIEAYELAFQDELEVGAWKAIVFFPDIHVEFVLHPKKEFGKNVIRGGALNTEYGAYQVKSRNLFEAKAVELSKIEQALRKEDAFESAEYRAVIQQLQSTEDEDAKAPIYLKKDEMEKTRTRYTEKGRVLVMDRQDSLTRAMFSWRYEYIRSNPSLVSYYLMWADVFMEIKNDSHVAKLVVDAFPIFEKKYPNHVYTAKIRAQLTGLQTIVPGNKYIDFKAPSIDGDTLQLSALIKNKVALIDMWGSWCGPCIAKSRQVVPLYNKYKSKGFEVVGIAREFKTTDAVKKRLSLEQFSWTNLVELDDKNNIWNQYGISNGSGIMVLVDRDGTILSVDPRPEELEKILAEKLNLVTTTPEIVEVYEYEATDKTQNHYLVLEKVDGKLKGKYFGTHDGREHGVGVYFYKVDVEKLKLVDNGEVEFEIGTRWLYESSQFKVKDPQKDSPMGRTSDVIQYKGQVTGDVIKLTCYSANNSCWATELTFKKIVDLK